MQLDFKKSTSIPLFSFGAWTGFISAMVFQFGFGIKSGCGRQQQNHCIPFSFSASFCSLFSRRQTVYLYSATICKAFQFFGWTTAALVFQLSRSLTGSIFRLFTCDMARFSQFKLTHIADQAMAVVAKRLSKSLKYAYNSRICKTGQDG